MMKSENGYDRLRTLYRISKLLATFESIKITFPQILASAAESFPLLTVVLVEHWDENPRIFIWNSADASPEQISEATIHAKNEYDFLTGEISIINSSSSYELTRSSLPKEKHVLKRNNYIVLPLILDSPPPLGALQFEGASTLDESDLEFVNALSDLITVALDRFYKRKREEELSLEVARNNLITLYNSQDTVEDLKVEGLLRESFVSLLTHDLRSPLTVILGSAQMILRKPSDEALCVISAQRIVKQVNRVGKMISDLLDANKIRSGESIPLKKELVNITNLIQETISDLSSIYGDRFTFKNDHDIKNVVDPNSLRRIIENLCNNAVKYGSPKDTITITLVESDKMVVIEVHNTGGVISKEDQKSLFEQFRRSETANKSFNKGWGIGLTLVRGMAEAHGGNVTVSSEVDTGTVFTVKIPKVT